MGQDVINPIRDFQYDFASQNHRTFLQTAFSIGMFSEDPVAQYDRYGYTDASHEIRYIIPDDGINAISLVAENSTHQLFVSLGLRIGLFSPTFLEYLEYGLGDSGFLSESIDTIKLLMQGVEQAIREAFDQPASRIVQPAQIETAHKKNFSQMMGKETVEIIVGAGEDAKEFVFHKDLLMDKVEFFQKMFNSGFLESSATTVTLPDDNPAAFEVLVEWVYCSTVKSLHGVGLSKHDQINLAISTVILAEKYPLPELSGHAMSFLVKAGKDSIPTMSQMSTLYKLTPPNAKARIYAARTVAWALDSDLLFDAIKEVRGTLDEGHKHAHEYPACDYHKHATAARCPFNTHGRAFGPDDDSNELELYDYIPTTKRVKQSKGNNRRR
ncbi:hypothetical protein V492_08411 [Pseudogymnoascus sp. VKM F-4246]|nr:hypothetical protein V492_08411 [Pseudogymnoascus sp. VKM F-4246]